MFTHALSHTFALPFALTLAFTLTTALTFTLPVALTAALADPVFFHVCLAGFVEENIVFGAQHTVIISVEGV